MSPEETTWLEELEAGVKQAAETIEALRGERDELARRIEELEARVGELEPATAKGKKRATGEKAAQAWSQERQEIRKRVEKLTQRLEGLLDS